MNDSQSTLGTAHIMTHYRTHISWHRTHTVKQLIQLVPHTSRLGVTHKSHNQMGTTHVQLGTSLTLTLIGGKFIFSCVTFG